MDSALNTVSSTHANTSNKDLSTKDSLSGLITGNSTVIFSLYENMFLRGLEPDMEELESLKVTNDTRPNYKSAWAVSIMADMGRQTEEAQKDEVLGLDDETDTEVQVPSRLPNASE